MHLHISPQNGSPIYLQIMEQVKYLLASGRLQPGDELPPIRALAQQLLINPNTVARAYRELEAAGLLESRQGSGTRVSGRGTPLARKERTRILAQRIDGLLAEARQLDFDLDDLIALLRERDERLDTHLEENRHGNG